MIPTYEEIMEQKSEVISCNKLELGGVFAVISYRVVKVKIHGRENDAMIVKLWSPTFTDSEFNTQEVWGCSVLKDYIEQGDYMLPFWIAMPKEQPSNYISLKAKRFNEQQINYFSWAKQAREQTIQSRDRDETMSTYSCSSQMTDCFGDIETKKRKIIG